MYRIAPKPYCKLPGCKKIKAKNCGGFCWDHRELDPGYERKKKKEQREKDETKLRRLLPTSENNFTLGVINENKVIPNREEIKDFEALKNWFQERQKDVAKSPVCMECGEPVKIGYYRHAVAHILFKSIFKSVRSHPNNFLILPASCCHDKTHRLDTFSKMKIFPEAVRRFRTFEHLITENHKLLDEFKKYASKYL